MEPTLNPLVIARRQWTLLREHAVLRASFMCWLIPCSIYGWFQAQDTAASYGVWDGIERNIVITLVMLLGVLYAYGIARLRVRKKIRKPQEGSAWWL